MFDIAIYIATASIASAILYDIIKIRKTSSNNIKSVKNAIREEIKNNIVGLRDYKLHVTKLEENWESMTIILISIGSYDSCINSGHLILLPVKLQSQINDLYMTIIGFNFQMRDLLQLLNQPTDTEGKRTPFVKNKLNGIIDSTIPTMINLSENVLKFLDE